MSIISVSSNCFSRGTDVARNVAESLDSAYVTREVVLESAEHFNVQEADLVNAIEYPPTVFERFSSSRASHIAYYRATLLRRLCKDNIVCHGLANHYFIRSIRHALTVRVVADLEDRIVMAMDNKGVSRDQAEQILARKDDVRRQWGLRIFGVDPQDPMLYDAVIHVGKMSTEGASDVVCRLASQEQFQATLESQTAVENQALAAYFEAITMDMQLDAEVTADQGQVTFFLKSIRRVRAGTSPEFRTHFVEDLERRLLERCIRVDGIESVKVELRDD